uniref:KH_dom_type_1 domain-containing protein n=1 Tax=Heterorhabditis bacteriophora TaxID=37862 RepID=A0A1I7W7V3_HETBA
MFHEAARKFMQSNSEKKLSQSRGRQQPEMVQLLPKRVSGEQKKVVGQKGLHVRNIQSSTPCASLNPSPRFINSENTKDISKWWEILND